MLINYKTQLSKKTQLTSDVWLYTFTLNEPKEISFVPGQYLILMVPQESGEKARRLYSIASPNTLTNEFELLIKLIPNGCASCYFEKLGIDSEVEFEGPAGMFTLRESSREKISLVTGTGYAPIHSMLLSEIEKLRNLETKNPNLPVSQSPSFSLFFGFPYYKDVFLFDELKSYKLQVTSFDFKICLSREQNLDMIPEEDKKYFFLGRVTNGLEQKLQVISYKLQDFDFYLCSGRDIVESLKQYLYDKGVPKEQVFFEKF